MVLQPVLREIFTAAKAQMGLLVVAGRPTSLMDALHVTIKRKIMNLLDATVLASVRLDLLVLFIHVTLHRE